MPAQFPSSHNVFVRSHDATNNMLVDFARNPTKFPVNRYCQIVPVKKIAGYYLRMTVEEAGRILNNDGRNFLWPDGMPAPEGNEGLESFEYFPFEAQRYAPHFPLGDLTVDQADWNILAQHARIKAQQLMTLRTVLAVTALTTSGNYASGHAVTVSAIPGVTGTWPDSTTARADVRRSLTYAAEKILDSTLSGASIDDLVLVINSSMARKLTLCQEIIDHIKGSVDSLPHIRGELPGGGGFYNLPNKLFGFQVVVEDTRKVTSKKGATLAVSQCLPEATPFMVARPGSLVAPQGNGPNFSTCCIFALEGWEMAVETVREENNKRTIGRCIDIIDVRVTAPISGVLFAAAS